MRIRRDTARLRAEIGRSPRERQLLREALDTARQRALLLRRIARLQQTRKALHLWHAFHRPLVWVMFVILLVHLTVAVYFGFSIGEISCPTKYFKEASSISLWPSVRYGIGVLRTAGEFFLQKRNLSHNARFSPEGRRLITEQEGVSP